MANQLTVQIQDTIQTFTRQGWKIRRIAKELGFSRNTVRQYVRAMKEPPKPVGEGTVPSSSGTGVIQIDPLSTSGKTGRKSLCEKHDELIRLKAAQGLSAQRIFQDLQSEVAFGGSYQSEYGLVRGQGPEG